jgi:hypothetical protein
MFDSLEEGAEHFSWDGCSANPMMRASRFLVAINPLKNRETLWAGSQDFHARLTGIKHGYPDKTLCQPPHHSLSRPILRRDVALVALAAQAAPDALAD